MIIYIACAGSGTRWNNYKGVPKHLVDVGGEPLLLRTVKQCCTRFPGVSIKITVPNEESIEQYRSAMSSATAEVTFIVPKLDAMSRDASALVSLATIFDKQDTLILLGDVYFTEAAMDTIATMITNTINFRTIGRKEGNPVTGCPHGELFAYYVKASYITEFTRIVFHVRNMHTNVLPRCTGWEIVSALQCWRLGAPRVLRDLIGTASSILAIFNDKKYTDDIFVEHIDETEDFDTPRDYVQWCVARTVIKN